MLSINDYKTLVKIGVLPAIDIIIRNKKGEILLGKRANSPAKGKWFVPGGRIFKNESVGTAFKRIVSIETGLNISYKDASFIGVYEHVYKSNYFGDGSFNTHYLVIAFEVDLIMCDNQPKINSQHLEFNYIDIEELIKSKTVHDYTKNYFIQNPENRVIHCKDIR